VTTVNFLIGYCATGCGMTDLAFGPRRRGRLWGGLRRRNAIAELAPELIDLLIDRVHYEWPESSFVLRTPSGEQVLVPSHLAGGPRCIRGHARYFKDLVLPFCEVDPIRRGGRYRMVPLAPGGGARVDAPCYELNLRSGVLTVGTGSAPGAVATH
jgi:hypothetical protein